MEVHKKADPKFARSLKPILPLLARPTGTKNNLDDTLGSDDMNYMKNEEKLILNLIDDKVTGSV